MSAAEIQPATPKPKLRWFHSTLQTLLIFVALAIPSIWLGMTIVHAKRERDAEAEAIRLGTFRSVWSYAPSWVRAVVGDGFFNHVKLIHVSGPQFNDDNLELLKDLDELEYLDLQAPGVTNAGLRHLERLNRLKTLGLGGTPKVTDAGLEHLKGLSQLEELGLMEIDITDAGLQHLAGLNHLRSLCLWHTKVTDAGVAKFQQALPNCKIAR